MVLYGVTMVKAVNTDINSEEVIHNMVTIADDTMLYTKVTKRVDLKSSRHKIALCGVMNVLTNLIVLIFLLYVCMCVCI